MRWIPLLASFYRWGKLRHRAFQGHTSAQWPLDSNSGSPTPEHSVFGPTASPMSSASSVQLPQSLGGSSIFPSPVQLTSGFAFRGTHHFLPGFSALNTYYSCRLEHPALHIQLAKPCSLHSSSLKTTFSVKPSSFLPHFLLPILGTGIYQSCSSLETITQILLLLDLFVL